MKLKDSPGGREFIASLVAAIADVALAMTGEPDDKVRAHLEPTRENLRRDLAETLGAETAATIADAFVEAVMGHKHELEAKGGGSA